jgi:hypothetical protein
MVLALSVVAAFHAGPAAAVDDDGRFLIKGVGSQPCSDYVAFAAADKLVVETWWAGYVTAYNRLSEDTYDVLNTVPPERANAWLENYCKEHKDELLALAVHNMLEYFYPRRLRISPNR